PCLRCRPELSPADGSWRRGDAAVARALKLIEAGALTELSLTELAEKVGLGERQLRRLFTERLGATPIGVHGTRRLLFAKQLLTETDLPITQVALAAGFGSLTRFNTTFREEYRMAPRELRKREGAVASGTLTLRMNYRPPYDFTAMLDFLRGRALPGVEAVDETSYSRVIGTAAAPGWLRVSAWPSTGKSSEHALKLELHGALPADLLGIVHRLRRMFDLDADPQAIATALSIDPRLRPLLKKRPGLRLPSGWDGFEIAVRAIIGQQVSVAAARTLTARLAQRFGTVLPTPASPELVHLFPVPEALVDVDLTSIGLTRARAATVCTVARALLDGRVDFRAERTLEDLVSRWVALPGIGPWTANYIALRATGHPDAFPADDLVLQKAVPTDNSRMTAKALTARAESWRPWRAYAVIQLWRDSMPTAKPSSKNLPVGATQVAMKRYR
ncbi:MAG TPA: AlkA N-terminal domain-containing protein, partial [Pseudoxanthomonas sp.]|nr:AlkA N-terminal domain-containing protein [Pseudoxanthomonas sp.]